jgi:acylphosphatase
MKRIGAVVEGRVQGVGFRYFTQETACRHHLSGWVRNTPEGNVELEAQGGTADIEAFVKELREGPQLSQVTGLRTYDMPLEENEQGFAIRH